MKKLLNVSICIPAFNEAKNIKNILDALVRQKTDRIRINEIVVVSSGSEDNTDEIVLGYQEKYPHVRLIRESDRNGKAEAINTFLKEADEEVVVLESADTIPRENAIEKLCLPFLEDPLVGMTGGASFPINDPNTFLGYVIHAWWWFHRNIPRFGEIIAFRNVLEKISSKTAVDEAYIQAKIIQKNYKVVHVDQAQVTNKGPETVRDLIKQRRRIFNGHARLHQSENIKIGNMTKSSVVLLLFKFRIYSPKQLVWFFGGIIIEIYARILGTYDSRVKKINPYIWDTAKSTKNLNLSRKT